MHQNNSSRKPISEVLDSVNKKNLKDEKMKVLKDNDSKALRFVLQAGYDDNVQTLLPDGEPPFNPVDEKEQVTLHELADDIPKLFKYGPLHNAPGTKVEMLFMKMLSSIQKDEAVVLVLMKDKMLQSHYKKLTKSLVKEFLSDKLTIK